MTPTYDLPPGLPQPTEADMQWIRDHWKSLPDGWTPTDTPGRYSAWWILSQP